MADNNRSTKFPLPKNELYYYDENSGALKPLVDGDGMLPVQSVQKKWRDSFMGASLDTNKWDVIQQGSGHTVGLVSNELQISTGTTINTETILQTKETFSDPFRVMAGLRLSQKIANQDFFIEAVSVDPKTGLVDGLHSVSWRFSADDNVTNDYAVYETQTNGASRLASTAVDTNVVQVYATAGVANYGVYELELFADEVWYHARGIDSPNGRTYSNVRHQQIPDPNAVFKVRIRAKNKGTAPASSTVFALQYITVIDYAELTAEITAGRGQGSEGQAIGVRVASGTLSAVSTVSTAYVSPKIVRYTDTTTNLSASGVFTGTARDAGSTALYTTYRVRIFADQPLKVEVYSGTSSTLTSNRIQQTITVPANTMQIIDVPIIAQYIGLKVTNTGTATTTAIEVLSILTGMI